MRKLSNQQIVNEAYQSARDANTRKLPLPPMNSDSSFKSLRQLANERKMREYEAELEDRQRRDTHEDPADYDYSNQGTGQNKKAVWFVLLVMIPVWIIFFSELAKEIK